VEQQSINTLLGLISGLFAIVGTCVMWWVNTIWSMVKSQQEQISNLNIKLAEHYVPRQELDKNFSRIFDELKGIREEVSHIARNQAQTKAMQDAMMTIKGQ
jgi:hypothetical protein